MATDPEPNVPVIDYTSRDYLALRDDLIEVIRMRVPMWKADNPSDFGLALVEAYAYGLDTIHYYLDRVANEAYLQTAIQRESLYSISEMFNYKPKLATPATVIVQLENTTTKEIVLEAGARVLATVPVGDASIIKNFETDEQAILAPLTEAAQTVPFSVSATEGRTYKNESLGASTGFVRQQFILPRTSVLPYSVRIVTELKTEVGGTDTQEWVEIDDLRNAHVTDRMFQVLAQTDGSSMVRFGDGFHGAIPPLHSIIRATYRVGGGSDGNVAAHTIDKIAYPETKGINVTNDLPASGGTNAESLSSIRLNAARSFRSRDRAVTLSDYVAVAESAPGMAKAKAIGNNGSSVSVYVVPESDEQLLPAADGTLESTLTESQVQSTTSYLEERSMAGVTVSVFDVRWIEVFMRIKIFVMPSVYRDDMTKAVTERMAAYFSFQRRSFNGAVSANSIYDALFGIKGINHVEVQDISLHRSFPVPAGEGATRIDTVYMNEIAENAVQYYRDASLSIIPEGGLAGSSV